MMLFLNHYSNVILSAAKDLMRSFAALRMTNILIIINTLLFSPLTYASTPTESLENYLSELHSMQANFTQVVKDGQGRIMQKSSGKMALLRPGKFRWTSNTPTKQLIVADGKKLWIYDQDLEQVTVKHLGKTLDNSPGMFLSNYPSNLGQYYTISSPKNSEHFLIKPKAEESQFTSIELQYDHNQLVFMQLHDQLGQITQLHFNQIEINTPLDPKLFIFHPPKGVDVVTGS